MVRALAALATLALVALEASAEPWLDAAVSKSHKKRDPIAKKYGQWIPETHMWRKRLDSVSYTHLTLPTKRIV